MPLLPHLTDTPDNVLNIVHAAHNNGARFIYPWFGLSMRAGQREYLFRKLEEAFYPQGLKQRYVELYGSTYICQSPRAKELQKLFESECNQLGILYRMKDIIDGYKKDYDYTQLTLF